jgi:N-acyl-phosphatidylethanolamine-hydrolysing phospholipase D
MKEYAIVDRNRNDAGDTASSSNGNNNQYQYDVAAIPIGAYEPRQYMYHNHMNVVEAIQMKDDIACRYAIPIHWGTFPLTIESVMEPRDQLLQLMKHRDDSQSFVPWYIGETKQY